VVGRQSVGQSLGQSVGFTVGYAVAVGITVGFPVGLAVGQSLGFALGFAVGLTVATVALGITLGVLTVPVKQALNVFAIEATNKRGETVLCVEFDPKEMRKTQQYYQNVCCDAGPLRVAVWNLCEQAHHRNWPRENGESP